MHVARQEFTIAQVAELKNMSVPTVRRMIARGELRAYRYGPRTIRIAADDLDRMGTEVNPTTFAHVSGE